MTEGIFIAVVVISATLFTFYLARQNTTVDRKDEMLYREEYNEKETYTMTDEQQQASHEIDFAIALVNDNGLDAAEEALLDAQEKLHNG